MNWIEDNKETMHLDDQKPVSEEPRGEKPRLSVVIPTLGRPIVVSTIRSVLSSRGADQMELLLVGDLHDVDVYAQVKGFEREYPHFRHIPARYPTGDSSRKKNRGAEESLADLVAFLDDDVVIAEDWSAHLVRAFDDEQVGLVSGPSLIPEAINTIGRLAGLALSSRAAGYVAARYQGSQDEPRQIKWSGIIGCNMVYRKNIFHEMGQFDPEFWPGEEMIAAHRTQRLGYKIIFVPRAYAYHYPRQNLTRFAKQIVGYGATRIRLIRAGVEFEWSTIVPMVWVLSLLILGIGAFFSIWLLWLLLLNLGMYALVDAAITLEMAAKSGKVRDLWLFLLIPLMHGCYGMGEWIELFTPNRDLSEKQVRT